MDQPTLIVDPDSGDFDGLLSQIEEALTSLGVSAEARLATTGVRATADRALAGGDRFLVAVGNDTTVHEIANAMMAREDHALLSLGLIPVSDSDILRTFGLPQDPLQACRHISGEDYYELDAGLITVATADGSDRTRYFVNIAQAGFGARTLDREARLPRSLGRARHFLGFWTGLAASRSVDVSVTVGRKSYQGPAYDIVVGNCQFFGGGLRLSPRSYPGDGAVDVLVMRGPRSDAFRKLPKMYRGEHVPSPAIVELSGSEVLIESEHPMPVHADGVVLGVTPASVRVVPNALRFCV